MHHHSCAHDYRLQTNRYTRHEEVTKQVTAGMGQQPTGTTLLTAGNGWQQVLILPTVTQRDDGILLDNNVSSRMLWLQLDSGRIWGLSYRSRSSLLSFSELEKIAQRLEAAQQREIETLPGHLAKLFGWFTCGYSTWEDLDEIAEDLVREKLRASQHWDQGYLLTDESLRKAAAPFRQRFIDGLAAFNAALDQELLQMIGTDDHQTMVDTTRYNYLLHPIEKISTYRRQAVQTFPLLGDLFTGASTEHAVQRLHNWIDAGNPLLTAVADYCRCVKTIPRLLAGKEYAEIGAEWQGQLPLLTDLLGMLPPDYWPKCAEEWQLFNHWLRPVFYALGDTRQRSYRQQLPGWLQELAKEGYNRIADRLERHGVSLVDITTLPDFERSLGEWAGQIDADPDQALEALHQYSILRLAQLSRRWHDWQVRRVGEAEPDLFADMDGDTSDHRHSCWLSLIDGPWPHGRHQVVPLTTPLMLQDEGGRMGHCVGSYASVCLYFGSQIFSIRDTTSNKSLSTVEMKLADEGFFAGKVHVVQHRGPANADPTPECQQTLKAFLWHLRWALKQERINDLQRQLQQRCEESAAFLQTTKIRWWSEQQIAQFRELLQGYAGLLDAVHEKSG